ncbi:alginate lyase family protein [Mycolicibacterium gilvum]|uniref:alginate lyase family protein n=1 Tax=Mycolicibacterium gilvum TaxID=1804 RepID=UPI004045FF43
MSKLAWYAGRIAAMSPGEIGWRVRQTLSGAVPIARRYRVRRGARLVPNISNWEGALEDYRRNDSRVTLLDRSHADAVATEQPDHAAAVISAAQRILAGRFQYFGYPEADCGVHVDWNYDPIADYRWPAADSWRIDHRVATADPKWIWELNRLQHLPILTEAWLFTGSDEYAQAVVAHLDSWIAQNPPGIGVAWRGAFEMGIRAISVAVALQGLRDWPGLTTDRFHRYADLLDLFAWHCWKNRSLYSSANNHLIGELAGLLAVHLTVPQLRGPARNFDRALAAVTVEADRQILADGANAEQSVSYQMFTAELLGTVAVLLRLRDIEIPGALTAALRRSAHYLVGLVGTGDPDPRYGDDDDSFALKLGPEPKRTIRAHVDIMAAITDDDSLARYGLPTLTASWIRHAGGGPAVAPAVAGETDCAPGMYAPDGGLVVLRDAPLDHASRASARRHDAPRASARRRVTMDVGPLGYLSIAAHGHADALSVTLSVDGHELIVDPGTASYYGHDDWRDTHRGTRAHPTVCVDGTNQSVIGGPFLWRQQARVTDVFVDLPAGVVDARHDGYRLLDAPVEHRRWLVAPPGDATVAVVDLISGTGSHHAEVVWPLHPDLDVTALGDGSGFRAQRSGSDVLGVFLAATVPARPERVRGEDQTQLGWWSERLEQRVPAWRISVAGEGHCPIAFLTLLSTADVTEPAIEVRGMTLYARWVGDGTPRELVIDTTALGVVAATYSGASPGSVAAMENPS